MEYHWTVATEPEQEKVYARFLVYADSEQESLRLVTETALHPRNGVCVCKPQFFLSLSEEEMLEWFRQNKHLQAYEKGRMAHGIMNTRRES